jgi:hypothetical protein
VPASLTLLPLSGLDLDVSLFERLAEGGRLPVATLEEQRRMRPAISDLIRATVYPNLRDHPRTHVYPPLRGLASSLFFLDLAHPEGEPGGRGGGGDDRSKFNAYEAEYIVCLARHMLLQGYRPGAVGWRRLRGLARRPWLRVFGRLGQGPTPAFVPRCCCPQRTSSSWSPTPASCTACATCWHASTCACWSRTATASSSSAPGWRVRSARARDSLAAGQSRLRIVLDGPCSPMPCGPVDEDGDDEGSEEGSEPGAGGAGGGVALLPPGAPEAVAAAAPASPGSPQAGGRRSASGSGSGTTRPGGAPGLPAGGGLPAGSRVVSLREGIRVATVDNFQVGR